MASRNPIVHDVFTAGEIARAAGASIGDADALTGVRSHHVA